MKLIGCFFLFFPLLLSENLEHKVKRYLDRLEKADTEEKAMFWAKKVVRLGKKAIPYVRRRQFQLTQKLYYYLWILKALEEKEIPPPRDFVLERLGWVKKAVEKGEYKQAKKILQALEVLLKPGDKRRREIAKWRIYLEEKWLQRCVLLGEWKISRHLWDPREKVEFQLELKNISQDVVEVHPTPSHFLGQIKIQKIQWNTLGQQTVQWQYFTISLKSPFSLAPQETWRRRFSFPPSRFSSERIEILKVQGFLRPFFIKKGARRVSRNIVLPQVVFYILPRKYHGIVSQGTPYFFQLLKNMEQNFRSYAKAKKQREKLEKKIFELQMDGESLKKKHPNLWESLKKYLLFLEREKNFWKREEEQHRSRLNQKGLELFYFLPFVQGNDQAVQELCYSLHYVPRDYVPFFISLLRLLTGRQGTNKKQDWILWCFKKYQKPKEGESQQSR